MIPRVFRPLLAALALLACIAGNAPASEVFGTWREPRAGVDVELGACPTAPMALCGRIVRIAPGSPQLDNGNADPALRARPLLGLEIVSGFERVAPDRWQGGGDFGRRAGRIYLPSNGDTLGDHRNRYEIRLQGQRLVIGIANCGFFDCLATSTWQRVEVTQ